MMPSASALGAKILSPNGFVAIYGPFKLDNKFTTPSNQAFDGELVATGVAEIGEHRSSSE